MTTTTSAFVSPRTWGLGESLHEVEIPIRYRKRDHGLGYYVLRADTGHTLGMVSNVSGDGWKSFALVDAFHPAAADLLTKTQGHPGFPGSPFQGFHVETSRTREAATEALVSFLANHRAEATEDLVEAVRSAAGFVN